MLSVVYSLLFEEDKVAEGSDPKRKTGINILGDAPWGTHFCQFYQTKEDLLDILVPYFKAGLENNEFCMWVTSDPLSKEEAENALRKAVPDLDQYLKRKQMEIIPHTMWYVKDGSLNLKMVLNSWIDKHDQALAKGYEGLRVTGNIAWLERKDWKIFADYEAEVNNAIGKFKMLAICSYSLDKCEAAEMLDVVSTHQFALIKRDGKWIIIESTERKQVGETLKLHGEIMQNMSEGIILIRTRDGIIVYTNPKFDLMFGYGLCELVGKNISTVNAPRDDKSPEEIAKEIQSSLNKTGTWSGEVYNIKKDGTPFWCYANVSTFEHSEHGKVWVAAHADITERKRAEEKIKEDEEKYRTLVENLPQKIFYKDRNSVYISCNQNYALDLKIKADEITGKTDYDFYTKELAEKYRADDKRIMMAGKVEDIEEKYIREGKERFVHTVKTPVKDDNGNVVGILGIFWDITERKRTEESLKQSQEQLVLSERLASLGRIAAGVAHELNNPLTGVLGMSQLMLEEIKKDDPKREEIEIIEDSALRCKQIIQSLLSFAQKTIPEFKKINLKESLDQSLRLAKKQLTLKDIRLKIDIFSAPPEIEADRGQLTQVFLNLLYNSIEAVKQKGIIKIDAQEDKGNNHLILTFEDNGAGIDTEYLPHIFEPFFTTKKKEKGTGLGLSITYGIIQAHNGSIECQSQKGKGTTFTLMLPVKQAAIKGR